MLIQKKKKKKKRVRQQSIWLVKNVFCIFKLYLISVKGYENGGGGEVDMLIIKKTGEIWVSMKTVQDGLGVKNMSDLILKQIHRIYDL